MICERGAGYGREGVEETLKAVPCEDSARFPIVPRLCSDAASTAAHALKCGVAETLW